MKNTTLYKAATRGYANHGWLQTHHSFSFANYRDNDRIHFGVLRVLNDDYIAPGMGFGTHPHDNMEIITLPLSGAIAHRDSMGNGTTIKQGDIQIMSAGTGIQHSEYNASDKEAVEILQIWIFPNQAQLQPRYDQATLDPSKSKNLWDQILSPSPNDDGIWIHQNTWFHLTNLSESKTIDYILKDPKNGIFIFVIEGSINIENETLHRRDALSFTDSSSFQIKANERAQILVMELPMELPEYLQ